MKISYMLKREDFYKINDETLTSFFRNSGKKIKLYIYPELNAIICNRPSKKVKEYLYTEYHVTGSWKKRLLVWLYTRICLNSFGICSSKRIRINADITNDVLIYPCNRKYRIFDFKNEVVSVVVKASFSNSCLQNEIKFRTKCNDCDFILPIIEFADFCYKEKIIDGVPLARISENIDKLKNEAFKLWTDYVKNTKKTIKASEYSGKLCIKIEELKKQIKKLRKKINYTALDKACEYYLKQLENSHENIDLILSHGDLQSGNIWVENNTNKIYIIDWESVSVRSIWYDNVVLYDGIREINNFKSFVQNDSLKHVTIIAEELIYRMEELCQLPMNYGVGDFDKFINNILERKNV
ncbi:MAG: phosphotransferase [Clostridia bacterium]|nr:phosphotransferase [Clostridia bacterium]